MRNNIETFEEACDEVLFTLMANVVDAHAPAWYADWCERDGTDEELLDMYLHLTKKE